MSKYLVTSERLIWPRGTVIETIDLKRFKIDALIAAGHISAHKPTKPAKTINIPKE